MTERSAERLGDAVLELAHAARVDGVERFTPRSAVEVEALKVARVWVETGGDLGAVGEALRSGVKALSGR